MDTAAILEQYTQDLSNLPSELAHLLGELKEKDARFYETRKRIVLRDNSIHKFIRQNGTLTKFPKEQATYQRMEEDFALAEKYQKEKCILANTALLLIAKHLVRLENDIGKLESEGLLAPLEEINMYPALTSAPTPTAQEIAVPLKIKKRKQSTNTRNSTPLPTKPIKRLKTEELEDKKIISVSPVNTPIVVSSVNTMPTNNGAKDGNEEDQLYCFCQQVSFGNMVGCDNDDCKYEWFHYDCVGLKEPPVGKWFCSDCKAKLALSREKKKK